MRRLSLLAVLVLVLVGLLPLASADARFAKSRALPSTTIATRIVAPPTNVSAVLASCGNPRWMNITVSWTASPTSGVTGYVVNAHYTDGTTRTVAETAASVTSAVTTADKLSSGSTTVTFTVITRTAYGWTAESGSSGSLTC